MSTENLQAGAIRFDKTATKLKKKKQRANWKVVTHYT